MATAAARSSANTDLYIGTLKASIGLFGTQAKPGQMASFDTAGPNGGVLKYEQRGAAAPETAVEQPDAPVERRDALSDEPSPSVAEAIAVVADAHPRLPDTRALVDGEFRQVLVEEGSGEVVTSNQVRRGVRLADGSFVDCTAQVDAIVERTKLDRMEVVATIDSTQIRRERVIGSYYIGAQDPQAAPVLRLFYEALRSRREVAIVKYTTRSRQQLGVVAAHAKTGTLVLLSLVFAEDFREAPAKARAIQKVSVPQEQVAAMAALLGALHGTVDDIDGLRDDAIALREELRVRAEAGEMSAEVVEPLPVVGEVPDLAAAMQESIAAVRAGKV